MNKNKEILYYRTRKRGRKQFERRKNRSTKVAKKQKENNLKIKSNANQI
jgi:hypothetical protein